MLLTIQASDNKPWGFAKTLKTTAETRAVSVYLRSDVVDTVCDVGSLFYNTCIVVGVLSTHVRMKKETGGPHLPPPRTGK